MLIALLLAAAAVRSAPEVTERTVVDALGDMTRQAAPVRASHRNAAHAQMQGGVTLLARSSLQLGPDLRLRARVAPRRAVAGSGHKVFVKGRPGIKYFSSGHEGRIELRFAFCLSLAGSSATMRVTKR